MNKISNNVERKFTDIINLCDGWQIETDDGFKPVTNLMKTIPYEEWSLELEENMFLLCADNHIVFDEHMNEIFVKDLKIGDKIQTRKGIKQVVKCFSTGKTEPMFDLQVNSFDHRYYSNDILSHNTTCSAAFILWKSFFTNDHTTLLVGNIESAAIEIMDRIKFAYENMEDYNWLRPGVTKYDRKTIHFDNNSRIICKATTASAGRGLSVSLLYCLTGDNEVTVKNKETGEIKIISLENLYNDLDVSAEDVTKSVSIIDLTDNPNFYS